MVHVLQVVYVIVLAVCAFLGYSWYYGYRKDIREHVGKGGLYYACHLCLQGWKCTFITWLALTFLTFGYHLLRQEVSMIFALAVFLDGVCILMVSLPSYNRAKALDDEGGSYKTSLYWALQGMAVNWWCFVAIYIIVAIYHLYLWVV